MISEPSVHILLRLTLTLTQLQFADEETKPKVICPRSHSYRMAEPLLNSRFLLSNSFSFLNTSPPTPATHRENQCDLQ